MASAKSYPLPVSIRIAIGAILGGWLIALLIWPREVLVWSLVLLLVCYVASRWKLILILIGIHSLFH